MNATTLPAAERLTGDQLRGWACALCGVRLYRDRPLGLVADPYGKRDEYVELWACEPACPCTPRGPGECAR